MKQIELPKSLTWKEIQNISLDQRLYYVYGMQTSTSYVSSAQSRRISMRDSFANETATAFYLSSEDADYMKQLHIEGKLYFNSETRSWELKEGGLTEDLENSSTSNQKPPIGITPKYLYDEQVRSNRFSELKETIKRYCDAGLPLNPEWVTEYDELVKSRECKVYTFKGKRYKIFQETKVKIEGVWVDAIIYQALYFNPDGEFWVRTKKEFFDLFKDGRM